jgi:hypothetical protein
MQLSAMYRRDQTQSAPGAVIGGTWKRNANNPPRDVCGAQGIIAQVIIDVSRLCALQNQVIDANTRRRNAANAEANIMREASTAHGRPKIFAEQKLCALVETNAAMTSQ